MTNLLRVAVASPTLMKQIVRWTKLLPNGSSVLGNAPRTLPPPAHDPRHDSQVAAAARWAMSPLGSPLAPTAHVVADQVSMPRLSTLPASPRRVQTNAHG